MAAHPTTSAVAFARGDAMRARTPVTVRALVLGALLIPPNILWVHSMELVWNSGQPTMLSLFFNAVLTLMALAVVNLALRRWRPRWALSPGEMATIYVMVSFAIAVAGHDFLQVLANQLPFVDYYANSINNWEELFRDHLASGLLVTDHRAVWDFWEGDGLLYSRASITPWLVPIGAWSVLVLALVGAMLLIDVFVWRRWTEQEKLTYPLTEIPFKLTEPGMGIIGPELMGNSLFWVGFGIAAAIDIVNGIGTLYPAVPVITVTAIDLTPHLQAYPWRAMGNTWVSVYPFAIGLGYLMPQDFLFSCWFFYWFWKLEMIGSWVTGYQRMGVPFVREQTVGAYLGIAVFVLWSGRCYFAGVIGEVLRGVRPSDERRQALPYRATLAGIVGTIALAGYFVTSQLGVSTSAAAVYLGGYLLLSLAITRMRAEFGLPVHDLFTGPLDMMARIAGVRMLGDANVKGLSLLWWLERVQRSHPMPHGIEGLALGERRGLAGPGNLGALGLATVLGVVAGFWATLHLAYTHGFASTPGDAPYLGQGAFSRPQSWLAYPKPPDWNRLAALGVGGAFTIGLLLMRQRYVWWPFHPAGYAASSVWFIGLLWVPLLVAWIVKGLTLRYGGQRLYRHLLPMFLGLTLGEFMVGGMWGLIGTIGRFPTYRFWAY